MGNIGSPVCSQPLGAGGRRMRKMKEKAIQDEARILQKKGFLANCNLATRATSRSASSATELAEAVE